ncbi:colanic acid exporter [Enterobacter hormaechei]|nr:oligosaccharide flippase family protein [Enterobacter hormaechei]CZU75466.1 colanic acid exporter [Enterobacter hormaechei]
MKYLHIIKKYSFFSISPLITALIQLFSVFIIGHTLSGPELGLAGIFNTLIFILVFISDGGSSNYFIYRKILSFPEVRIITVLNVSVSFLSILLYFVLSPNFIESSIVTLISFFVMALSISFPLYHYSRLLVEKKFNTIAMVEVFSKFVFIASLSALIYRFQIQGVAVVYAWTASYVIRCLIFIVVCRGFSLYQENSIKYGIKNIIRRWWAYIHNQIFSQFLNYITLTADIFIVSHFGGLERVGVYSLCKDATLKISAVISPVIGKLLISHVVTSDIKVIHLNAKRIFLSILFVAMTIFLAWSVVGPYLLQELRPDIHSDFEIFIYAWAICGVLRMLINPVATIFQGLGETRKELYINLVSSLSFIMIFSLLYVSGVITGVINIILITLIGMYVISLIYSGWLLQKRFQKI